MLQALRGVNMEFLLMIPIIFIIALIQTFYLFRGYRSYIKRNTWQIITHSLGVLGLISSLLITGYIIFLAISSSSYFCHGTGCQAAGYIYIFATPIAIGLLVISEILLAIGSVTEAEAP